MKHLASAPRRAAPTVRAVPIALAVGATLLLSACASEPESIVKGPLTAPPVQRPAAIEHTVTGSLFQPGATSLFSGRQKPRNIGDTLKVDIAESVKTSTNAKTDIQRQSDFSSKGKGDASQNNLLRALINQDVAGTGKSTFKGDGTMSNDDTFQGQLAASVVNVLPNGNLIIAGERSIATGSETRTMRFSGLVNPNDIKEGNIVASADVVNARLEIVGKGDIAEGTKRNWLQRLINDMLTVW